MTIKAKPVLLSLLLIAASAVPTIAFAEGGTWSLDSTTSSARFFQGSTANPDSVNTGVARVSGKVILNPNDLANSVLDLAMYPADENWKAMSADGSLPTGFVPNAGDTTLLSFKSGNIVKTSDGRLQVTGNLTVTHVERSVTLDPNEAYSGAVYGPPVVHTATRQVTFVFPNFAASEGAPSVAPAMMASNNTMKMRASTEVRYQDFPELLAAVTQTNWPAVIENEDCQMPSNISEDYRGASCTGTMIAETSYKNCQMPANVNESYSGANCAPPAGKLTTIALELNLAPEGSKATKVLSGAAQ